MVDFKEDFDIEKDFYKFGKFAKKTFKATPEALRKAGKSTGKFLKKGAHERRLKINEPDANFLNF